jgi:tubulin--tyrosine ligase
VGPGNNSGLIVRVLRSRPWWVQTDKRKEANLIWTSLKHSKTLKKLPSGKNVQIEIVRNFSLPRKKQQDSQMFGFHLVLDSIFFQKIESSGFSSVKLCNKLEENEQIASKKLLFSNMKSLYSRLNKNLFEVIPVTFHVKSTNDPEFSDFEAFFNSNPNSIWIVKPGENTNRGKGISLAASVSEVKALVSDKSSSHTCIIQKYIERPLLINKRKFDIRCFALMTSVNSVIQGYFYTEGYIRTSSKEFSLKNLENKFIHLTNDAIQKHSEDYGKFEPSNKMSYAELQNYITQTYPKHGINFEKDLLSKIKEIVSDSFSSVSQKIDPHRRLNCFELFGFDFMIDEDFHVWLIEANTNPCLETSCAFLSRVIPACIDNTFRIVADPLFPSFDNRKGCSWIEEGNIGNKFELVYNELIGTR